MNKLFTKIAGLSLGLAMAIGVGVAVASSGKEATPVKAVNYAWQKVTSTSEFVDGTEILVTQGSYYLNVSATSTSQTPRLASLTLSNGLPTLTANNTECFLVSGSGSSIKLCKATDTTKWLITGSSNNAARINTGTTGNYWTISSAGTNEFYLRSNSGSRYLSRYQTTDFRSYTSSGTNANLVLYKLVESASYTVTFNANGHGTAPSSQTISQGGKVTKPSDPTATGYTFGGWYKEQACSNAWNFNSDTVSGITTLWAKWTANNYNINYYDQGGSAFSGSHESGYPTTHTYGTATTLKSATKGGHSFDGWFTTSACTGSAITSLGATSYTAAISLYAKWTATGTTYSISTTVTNGTYSGDTTITDNGGVASVTISPTGDYKLPTSVSVSGASHTYNADTGVISLSGATGNVTISAAMVALTEYSITVNETNGSHTGASTIKESRSASLTFTPDSGYGNPSSVTVSGATSSWTRGTGVLSLSNPTGNVTVTYVAVGNELDSITISTNSGSYTLGDNFVMPTVTAKYTINADADVTSSASYSGYDPYTTGNQNVTISYTEGGITKTQSYTANVSAASVQTTTYYQKCTSMSDIVNGGKYVLIGYKETTTTYYAMPSYSSGNNIQGASVTLTENETRLTEANMSTAAVYTLTSTGTTNQYYIGDGTQYLYAAGSGTNNHLKGKASTDDSAGAFTISYSTFFSVVAASSNRNTMRFNASNNPPIFSCYASNDNQTEIMFFKEVKEQTGSADLIRITASYSGDPKYVGDPISTSDFTVKKQLNTGNELIDVASGYTISANTLTAESNSITVSYTEGNKTKTDVVVVPATPRSATVTSVTLVQGIGVVKDYIDYSAAAWDYTGLTVHCVWSDSTFNEDLSVADLIQSGDATVSPAKPAVGVSSFTISYEYHEVSMTSNSVTGINVVADYVTGISWTGTTGSHFKAFSGSQLTAAQVGAWSVVPTLAGAGQQSALSFGSYTLKVGNKTISSLPYTWASEDDGQKLTITYGKDENGEDFVKENGTAVANICATINAIDHSETITGEIEKSVTWSKDDSIAAYGTTSLCDDGVALDENIFMQGAQGGAGTEIRFWSDGIRTYTGGNTLTFTPSNGAVITKITLPTVTVTSDSTSSASSPYTITDGDSAVVFDIGSKSTIGSDIVVEYTIEGSETTTVHYANDMNHFDAQKKVVEFAKFVNETMNGANVCSGTFANLSTAWGSISSKYTELFGASTTLSETELAWAKNMLKYATASWASELEPACVERAMKTYEFCITNHSGVCNAFMVGVRSVSSININPLQSSVKNAGTSIAIIAISAVSLAAIGGYFLFRKKKEN